MNKFIASSLAVIFSFILLSLISCGGGGGSSNSDTTTTPTASATPTSPALIKGDTAIVIHFSTSMDTATLQLGGTLPAESDSGVWTATSSGNDTLTISPATAWSSGAKTLTIDAKDTAGTLISTLSLLYTVDTTLPVASVDPTNASSIATNRNIVITYSESMDIASLSGGGTLWAESDGGAWSTTTNPNDTLTISPAASWSVAGQTLDVSANDLAGNNHTLNLAYTVVSGTDADSDGSPAGIDCDDNDATVYPGAAELCDGKDNDCNTLTDDNTTWPSYPNSTTYCGGASGLYITCDFGTTDCDGNIVTGCETDLSADPDNCGACGNACNDNIACTSDICVSGLCQYQTNDAYCDDGLYCDGTEICNPADAGADSAGCVSGIAVTCPDQDMCNVGICDENTDSCSTTPAVAGTQCNDGNASTYDDQCNSSGVCYGTPAQPAGSSCTFDYECLSGTCDVTNICL